MFYFPQIKNKFLNLLPVLLLYFFSFYNFEELKSIGKINFFSFNFQMILIYFYVLKYPEHLGFGKIQNDLLELLSLQYKVITKLNWKKSCEWAIKNIKKGNPCVLIIRREHDE